MMPPPLRTSIGIGIAVFRFLPFGIPRISYERELKSFCKYGTLFSQKEMFPMQRKKEGK
jgi:hypothetical protein